MQVVNDIVCFLSKKRNKNFCPLLKNNHQHQKGEIQTFISDFLKCLKSSFFRKMYIMSHRPALVVVALLHVPEPQPRVEAVGELEQVLDGVVLVRQRGVHGLELQIKKGDPYLEKYPYPS